MPATYLAIDIGASSGRHIVSFVENGKIETREVYRFPNGAAMKDGCLGSALSQLSRLPGSRAFQSRCPNMATSSMLVVPAAGSYHP